jgi:hypothetical protein
MALKFKYKIREEVPAESVGLYVERDGAWLLDAEGAVDPASVEELPRASKAKLEEFRATNVALIRSNLCASRNLP